MNFKSSLTFGLALFLSATLFSKNIYIKFDPACMDRLEYRLNGNMAGNGLISYSLKANATERVVMEIGVESIRQVKRLPRGTKTCGKIKANELLANSINSGKDKIYIVRQVGRNYIISPVHLATYMKDSQNQFSMRGNELDMAYSTSDIGVMENNLSDRTSSTKVYFIGSEKRDCRDAYELKKIPIETCKPFTDLTFLPGLGIIQEKTGVNQAEAENNILQLVKINNIPLAEYLASICGGREAEIAVKYQPEPMEAESPAFTPATTSRPKPAQQNATTPARGEVIFPMDNQPPAPEYRPAGSELVYEYDQPQKPVATFRPKGANCKELSYPGVHIVQTNQTLYSISRQYNITVKQLREWNKLGSKDLIKPCASLYVLPPNQVNASNDVPTGSPTGDQLTARGNDNPKAEILFRNVENATPADAIPVTPSRNVNTTPSTAAAPANTDAIYNNAAKQTELLFPKSGEPRPESFDAQAASPRMAKADDSCKKLAYEGMHIVQKGETLFSISKRYDLTVKQIQTWNKLGDKSKITPCMSLYVKTPAAVIAAVNNPDKGTENYKIPNEELGPSYTNAPANGTVSSGTTPKGSANVNLGTTTPKGAATANPASGKMWDTGIEYHVVQKGETLTGLAKMYGFTLERFRDINGLGDSNIIRIGQVLRTGNCLCPADAVGPTESNTYRGNTDNTTVNTGSAQNNTNTTGTIISGNGTVAAGNTTTGGMTEKGGERTTERSTEFEPVPVPYDYETENIINSSKRKDGTISYRNGRKVHTVQDNETMASIANKYNISIDVLRKLNKMEKNEIVIPDMKIYLE